MATLICSRRVLSVYASLLLALLHFLRAGFSENPKPLSFIDAESVKKWIDENLSTIQRVEDVARGLRCHPETLRKKFHRTHNGQSLWEYVLRCRLEKMKHLLRTTDAKCVAICYEVGILREDEGLRFFKRRTGMTMSEYRQRVTKRSE